MKRRRVAAVAALLLLIPELPNAQDQESALRRFRVLLRDGKRIEGKNGRLSAAALVAQSRLGDPLVIPREQIRFLDRSAGSQARNGAAIGAALGLMVALSIVRQADRYGESRIDEASLVVGSALGGGAIGLLVGSATPKWERVQLTEARERSHR